MRTTAAAIVCCLATLLLAATSAAAAKPEPKVTPGSTYLALGDSVSFGYQEGDVVPKPDYSKASNFLGWPEHTGRALRLKVVNASCPGETSASLIDPSAQAFGCENTAGNKNTAYRRFYPLHVKYSGSQLSFALSYLRKHRAKTRLVSLMVGANDLFLCQATTKDGCASELQATYAKVAANVKKIIGGVRKKAGYRGQIVLMRYYALHYGNDPLAAVVQGLNAAAYKAAKPYHVRVADGYGEWRRATRNSGDDACTAGLLTQLGDPSKCGVHPSWSGQALLSQALIRAIRR
jgi:lysophospholipase L1-like esterase